MRENQKNWGKKREKTKERRKRDVQKLKSGQSRSSASRQHQTGQKETKWIPGIRERSSLRSDRTLLWELPLLLEREQRRRTPKEADRERGREAEKDGA